MLSQGDLDIDEYAVQLSSFANDCHDDVQKRQRQKQQLAKGDSQESVSQTEIDSELNRVRIYSPPTSKKSTDLLDGDKHSDIVTETQVYRRDAENLIQAYKDMLLPDQNQNKDQEKGSGKCNQASTFGRSETHLLMGATLSRLRELKEVLICIKEGGDTAEVSLANLEGIVAEVRGQFSQIESLQQRVSKTKTTVDNMYTYFVAFENEYKSRYEPKSVVEMLKQAFTVNAVNNTNSSIESATTETHVYLTKLVGEMHDLCQDGLKNG